MEKGPVTRPVASTEIHRGGAPLANRRRSRRSSRALRSWEYIPVSRSTGIGRRRISLRSGFAGTGRAGIDVATLFARTVHALAGRVPRLPGGAFGGGRSEQRRGLDVRRVAAVLVGRREEVLTSPWAMLHKSAASPFPGLCAFLTCARRAQAPRRRPPRSSRGRQAVRWRAIDPHPVRPAIRCRIVCREGTIPSLCGERRAACGGEPQEHAGSRAAQPLSGPMETIAPIVRGPCHDANADADWKQFHSPWGFALSQISALNLCVLLQMHDPSYRGPGALVLLDLFFRKRRAVTLVVI